MKKPYTKLFIVCFNIAASLLFFANGKLIQIDEIWIRFLLSLLLIWNVLLFYMLQKNNS
ncbi:hypothetical protein BSF42_40970 [Flavobacterium sp. ACN6]|nr:hypothetical protein BSF42_40970 [Flavobacterium sp. ACN6]